MRTTFFLFIALWLIKNVPVTGQTSVNVPTMIFIAGSSFQMGSRAGDADERPIHPVTLSPFYLASTETTFAQFQAFVAASGYVTDAERGDGSFVWDSLGWHKAEGLNWRHDERGQGRSRTAGDVGSYPVLHVSWQDAVQYCNWLSKQDSLQQVYGFQGDSVAIAISANGYRLPTEAEWEYAAAAGRTAGDRPYAGVGSLNALGWYSGNARGCVHATASLRANGFGLYDLTGNVWEWCQDWYSSRFYTQSSAAVDPSGPASGLERALRGGSWNNNRAHCRLSNRSSRYSDFRDGSVGFRVARW